ncbi:hypothetical protein [Gryllotalpicola protaetiae]|uniref:Uncharacterized protein n=1 Tax=Gryllotalpicola protaetiae TaxID=2419771 RepID=A0A387BR29_9MICO|nr:hypothetical protein [Gryllotalpicola protaetiae]AYG03427.1 hypothetical protein D7I44_07680 [Gryllotalpicola protaetiae]
MNVDDYAGHGAWTALASARDALDDINKSGDKPAIERLDEIRELFGAADGYRDGGDPMLTGRAQLDQMNNVLSQIDGQLRAYSSNTNMGHVENAANLADALRAAIIALPRPIAGGRAQADVTRAFNAYKEELDKSRDGLAQQLKEAQDAAATRESELTTQIDSLKAEVSSAQQAVAALKSQIEGDETRLTTALKENGDLFVRAQTDRETGFQDWLTKQEKSFADLAKPHLSGITASEASAKEQLDRISTLRTSSEELAQIVAGDIMAEKFEKSAQNERVVAYIAYGVGAVAVLIGAIVIFFAFGWFADHTIRWENIVLKIGLTLVLGSLSAVAFRFGGQAIQRATAYRRQELDIRALQPFLADLDDKAIEDIKTTFIDRAFGHAWEPAAQAAKDASDGSAQDMALNVLKLVLQELPKNVKP